MGERDDTLPPEYRPTGVKNSLISPFVSVVYGSLERPVGKHVLINYRSLEVLGLKVSDWLSHNMWTMCLKCMEK